MMCGGHIMYHLHLLNYTWLKVQRINTTARSKSHNGNGILNDAEQIKQLRQDTISGLKQINNIALPGKLKLWCCHFGLLPHLMWPIPIYEVTSSHISQLERFVNAQLRWRLGLQR